jgi:hypothetical protein
VNQPATTFAGYAITTNPYSNPAETALPVTVKLVINGASAPDGTQVTLSVDTSATGTCSLSNNTATTAGGVATFSTLSGAAGTGCQLAASGGGVNSTQDSASFDLVGSANPLVCAGGSASSGTVTPPLDPTSATPPPSDGQTGWALIRGTNTDGNCGDNIPYTFSCDNLTRTCQFTEDSLGQHPSIEYVILWPKVDVTTDPTADKQPCVAWGVTNPDPGGDPTVCGGDFVPGLACTTDNVNGGSAVMPTIPNLPPFNLGTTEAQYQYGIDPSTGSLRKAKVCIAQHGFTSGTNDANGNAVGFEVYWTKVIDQSDSTIKLP